MQKSDKRQYMDALRYVASKEGHYLQKCYYCEKKLVYGSDTFHAHLLFYHGKATEPCKTFRAKVDALSSIEGFKLRGVAKKMKRKFRSKRRIAKWNCWKWKVRFWFNYIEKIKYIQRMENS